MGSAMAGFSWGMRRERQLHLEPPVLGCSFLGTSISPLSLDELQIQVYREQPWLKREGGPERLPPKLLLAAAARAAKTDARRAQEALRKADKAAATAAAAAAAAADAADAANAERQQSAGRTQEFQDPEAVAAAEAAAAAAEEAAKTAAAKKRIAERCYELATSKGMAASYYWEGEKEESEGEDTPQLTCRHKGSWGVHAPRHLQEAGSEGGELNDINK
ncbi:hypothetical protein, conserved [Eimeria acervulina]|uniref:Uncharacterized protein n=1 Tax=Eimeria acervulina TaxID=5801 RepID=U6GY30_EIMAC|nr:hypothetical protein, conserved [Eimeria acervulina]CDI84138.1 hypothetical protein, conserved [Eimeria acervulina]